MVIYNVLSLDEINLALFDSFDRTQVVTKCWRKVKEEWLIKEIPFTDNWSKEEYQEGVQYLRNLIQSGGYVVGAFIDEKLKGFASVDPSVFGARSKYINLSNIHVSQDVRGLGIGKELFRLSKKWAKEQHAEKLYISAHSSVESQAFYKAMGCVEATEYNEKLVEKEPCDCQLECEL